MKKIMLTALFALGAVVGVEAAPTDADLQKILDRLTKLEELTQSQAKKIAELEGRNKALVEATASAPASSARKEEGTEVSESGKIYTTSNGKQYYLADATANIFEPLSDSGLQITPYAWMVFEAVYANHSLDCDWSADFVTPRNFTRYGNHNSTLSMADSIMGVQFMTPEAYNGWKFSGKAEFDLAGGNADDYAFHWRHLYVDAAHESGWSILFGQTWHLWKMVTPSEIDGAWMENAGHPYRRSPQLRITKKWEWDDSSLEARVGYVKNGPNASEDADDDGMLDSVASAWGWLEGALVYDHKTPWQEDGRRWLVGLGGMYGNTRAHRYNGDDDAFDGDDDDYESKMLMLAASVPFGDFTLTGQMFFGNNLGRVQAGCAQGIVYQPDNEKATAVGTYGGFIDLTYTLNDDWDFAVGYGFDDPVDGDLDGVDWYGDNAGSIIFNDRAYIDVFYHITGNFKLGLEYARLNTKYNMDGGNAYADRVQFSAFYDF